MQTYSASPQNHWTLNLRRFIGSIWLPRRESFCEIERPMRFIVTKSGMLVQLVDFSIRQFESVDVGSLVGLGPPWRARRKFGDGAV